MRRLANLHFFLILEHCIQGGVHFSYLTPGGRDLTTRNLIFIRCINEHKWSEGEVYKYSNVLFRGGVSIKLKLKYSPRITRKPAVMKIRPSNKRHM